MITKTLKVKSNKKKIIKRGLALAALLSGFFFNGCSTSIGPLKTSARISREALDSLMGLNSNPAVMEFYKKYEEKLGIEVEKESAKLENTRKILFANNLSDPRISYSARTSLIEEQKILEDFVGDITGDAFRDTIEEDSFRPFEWVTELKDEYFSESNKNEETKTSKEKSYLTNLLKTEKIDFGIRPSFSNRKTGGRVFAKAENFRIFTNFQEGKIEIGTDKKEDYKFRTELVKKINKHWYVSFNFKLGKVTRDDLSISFVRNYYDIRTRIKNNQKVKDERGKARLAVFAGYNKHDNEYIGLSLLKEF